MKVGNMVRYRGNPAGTLGILTEIFKYQSGLVRCRVRWFTGEQTPPENLWLRGTDVVVLV